MDNVEARETNVRPTHLLLAALTLGVVGEYLFSPGLLGLNVFAWTAALAIATVVLARANGQAVRGEGRWMLAPALLFAGFVAWRASPVLQSLNIAVVVVLLAIAAFRLRDGRVRVGPVSEYLWLGALSIGAAVTGFAEILVRHVDWRRAWARPRSRALPLLRGIVIAAPVLVVFGGLFAAADAMFSQATTALLTPDISGTAPHGLRALLWTWIAAGFLHCALAVDLDPLPQLQPREGWRLGPLEVSTVLGLVDLLFLAFVAFQVRYLFGGASHVQLTEGLTYAEYARQGFFELLAVAALVLPLVLAVHWLLRGSSPAVRMAFRLLAATLTLLVFAVIASALKRMDAYVEEFGLTQLRLYSTAAMIWLAIVFLWLMVSVLKEHRERFAVGAAAAGLLVIGGLNVLNPDALIVRTNLDRADQRDFDGVYALRLSPDATPTIAAALEELPEAQRCRIAARLGDVDSGDWRTWNRSREQAKNAAQGVDLAECDREVD